MAQFVAPHEAQTLMKHGGVQIIDVREPHEWTTGHVPSARLVPLGKLRANFEGAGLKDGVLFVCESGGRSRKAAELAEAHGLTNVYSMTGGTSGWAAAGLPLEHDEAPPSEAEIELDPELDAIVSKNFRELRAQRGFTLDVLAGLSGVGRQTLGQIELGHTLPSLGTLWKIAGAFDVPFSVLLARPASTATQLLKAESAKRIVGTDGRFSSRALFTPEHKGKVEFYELWLAAHAREDADAHAPGTRENLVVTTGRLVLELDHERYELAKGDAIQFVADKPHAYVNLANEECRMNLVMTYAP